ncbi:MAG TPA: hypothetical protein PLE16_08870 [Spirochaetota bacterium]|jgi:flagellar capping protein FliD|nr:hypothetical protein [Spirochaetota bacterium]HOH38319.1 hypothetical protein [Spirochaetota bacterium]HPJ15054.1 hypothetical protein [Spirochaetota bacterium]HPM34695.1 hypothetical protein [Spirochaetota bacterium]HQA53074.1 hypothetical protein [Spirochaetota bacterium]
MSTAMEFTKEQLEQIGSYIESNFDRFGAKSNVVQLRPYDIQLIERMTRIEEELRSQRELMQLGFNQMDKRFESMQKQSDTRFEMMQKNMDTRFDDMNKKFNMITWMMTAGFTIIATVITLISIFGK